MKRLIQEYLLENWSLKATALFLALILWLFVRGEPGPERVVAVPLEIRVPRQMEIINKRPSSIEVTMRGTPVSNMWFSQPLPTCVVDLQESSEGEHIVALTPDNIKFSKGSGIEVLQVSPARVTIVLESTVSKEVPVIVPVRTNPPPGYEIYEKFAKPSSVIISGPRSRIAAIHEVRTSSISLEGQTQSNSYFVNFSLKDNSIRTSAENPILVQVEIGPTRRLHLIQGIPVIADDSDYVVAPKEIDIQVLADPDLAREIAPSDFRASVKTKGLNAAMIPTRLKPAVQILNDFNGSLSIKSIQPSEVTIQHRK